ncbi:MAG: hypothetical protein AAGJ35_00850 [Myxococcota bacterium]
MLSSVPKSLRIALLDFLGLFLCCVLGGCIPHLRQAKSAEKKRQYERALAIYKQLGQQSQHPDAAKAQAARIRLLAQQSKWSAVLSETALAANFFDPEEPWSQRYHTQQGVWSTSRNALLSALHQCGRIAYDKARQQGEGLAYASSIRCFGLYLKHTVSSNPSRTSKAAPNTSWHRLQLEALLRRGEALAIREGCLEARPSLNAAQKAAQHMSSRKTHARTHPPHEVWNFWATLQMLRCEIFLWQQHRERPRHPKWKRHAFAPMAFSSITRKLRPLLQQNPTQTQQMLFEQAQQLERKQAFAQSLALLMLVIQQPSASPLRRMAQTKALQLFGQASDWGPLIDTLPDNVHQRKSQFWKRLRTLVMLHGLRSARKTLRKGQYRRAAKQYQTLYRLMKGHPRAPIALYQAALAFEGQRKPKYALHFYRLLLRQYPDETIAVMAQFRLALLLQRQGKILQSAKAFEELAYMNPMHMIAPRAYYLAYQGYREHGKTRKAKQLRRRILRKYPLSMEAKKLKKRP